MTLKTWFHPTESGHVTLSCIIVRNWISQYVLLDAYINCIVWNFISIPLIIYRFPHPSTSLRIYFTVSGVSDRLGHGFDSRASKVSALFRVEVRNLQNPRSSSFRCNRRTLEMIPWSSILPKMLIVAQLVKKSLPPPTQFNTKIYYCVHKSSTENLCNISIIFRVRSFSMAVFWVVVPCSVVEVYQRFRSPCCLHHQDQTTRRYNPEDSHLRTHRRENLKFYWEVTSFPVQSPRWRISSCRFFATVCSVYKYYPVPSMSEGRLLQPQPEDAPCRNDKGHT
jgi:hypothetical protein